MNNEIILELLKKIVSANKHLIGLESELRKIGLLSDENGIFNAMEELIDAVFSVLNIDDNDMDNEDIALTVMGDKELSAEEMYEKLITLISSAI